MRDPEPAARRDGEILLATDLSAGDDRALDRAVQLAHQWNAGLRLLTVIEPHQSFDEVVAWVARQPDDSRQRFVLRQLADELAALSMPAAVHVEEGVASECILRTVRDVRPRLVITGAPRDDARPHVLGGPVEHLVRRLSQPLLVVRARVRRAYERIVVATDLSETSRHAVRHARHWFPEAHITLFHASGSRRAPVSPAELAAAYEDIVRGDGAVAHPVHRLRFVADPGSVESALPRYTKLHPVDLVILGTRGRSWLLNVMFGPSAAALSRSLVCDTMLIRASRKPRRGGGRLARARTPVHARDGRAEPRPPRPATGLPGVAALRADPS